MRMASFVPASLRSRSEISISAKVGLTTNSPFTRPMRTAPTGPPQGMSEIMSAVEAALIARMSSGLMPSDENEYMMTCTSLRIPSWKSGRSGRSVRRAVRMDSVEARPSRRKNEPGILPPAYSLSSYSTESGKKSMPSRTPPMVAAAKTIASSMPRVTAPPAWPAKRPVSIVTVLLPTTVEYFLPSKFILSPLLKLWVHTHARVKA